MVTVISQSCTLQLPKVSWRVLWFFSKLKTATQSSRKWRLNIRPATQKLNSKLKACPANFHACHACHAWPISQRFASHELTQNQYIKNTIKKTDNPSMQNECSQCKMNGPNLLLISEPALDCKAVTTKWICRAVTTKWICRAVSTKSI